MAGFLNVLLPDGMQNVLRLQDCSGLLYINFVVIAEILIVWMSFVMPFQEAQRNSWKYYLSLVTVRTTVTEVFNKVSKISGKFSPSPPPIMFHAGNMVKEPMVVADLFTEHFINISRKDPYASGPVLKFLSCFKYKNTGKAWLNISYKVTQIIEICWALP